MKKKYSIKPFIKFAKPYWAYFLVALFFIIVSTLGDLLIPYLVKVAIDDHISANNFPLAQVTEKTDTTLNIGGEYFKRLDAPIKGHTFKIETKDDKVILTKNGKYYKDVPNDAYKAYRKIDINNIKRLSLIVLLVSVISFVSVWLFNLFLRSGGTHILYDIRNALFSHALSQDTSFYTKHSVGSLLTILMHDTYSIYEVYEIVLSVFIFETGYLVGLVIMMININLKLALISFAFIPLIIVISSYFRNVSYRLYQKGRAILSRLNSNLSEYLSGMNIIRIFDKKEKIAEKFNEKNTNYRDIFVRQVRYNSFFRPTMQMVRTLTECIIIYYGGGEVIRDNIEFGTLFLFINSIKRFYDPINRITEEINFFQEGLASAQKILGLLDEESEVVALDEYKDKSIDAEKGSIVFKDVYFSYVPDEQVLKGINFTINKGESVAFVGATGAGKTSIISLVNRLYDIDSGAIYIDGKDIRGMNPSDIRNRMGLVLQDVFLFSGDIKSNISLGEGYSLEEIKAAAKRVSCHDLIERLSDGYDTKVEERGITLSAGERQLLSFARTILRDPEILILDEATASIDTETELLIQKGLKELMKGRTTIAIAHRLSTIADMDRIIVLDQGRIVEMGTHEELLAKRGYYYNLYELQYK